MGNNIVQTMKYYQESVNNNPSKEVKLLEAMSYFCPEDKRDRINQAIAALNTIDTFRQMSNDLYMEDSSVHPDGVYDIDAACRRNKKVLFEQDNNFRMLGLLMAMLK